MKQATIAKIVRQFIEKECPLFCGYRLSKKTEEKARRIANRIFNSKENNRLEHYYSIIDKIKIKNY